MSNAKMELRVSVDGRARRLHLRERPTDDRPCVPICRIALTCPSRMLGVQLAGLSETTAAWFVCTAPAGRTNARGYEQRSGGQDEAEGRTPGGETPVHGTILSRRRTGWARGVTRRERAAVANLAERGPFGYGLLLLWTGTPSGRTYLDEGGGSRSSESIRAEFGRHLVERVRRSLEVREPPHALELDLRIGDEIVVPGQEIRDAGCPEQPHRYPLSKTYRPTRSSRTTSTNRRSMSGTRRRRSAYEGVVVESMMTSAPETFLTAR